MIPHTKAYDSFRAQGIALYDFCVLLSFAIPCLAERIKSLSGPVNGKIPSSKYIKNDNMTAEELNRRAELASDTIGKELLLSTFSYFEAYVADALQEILDFHGGTQSLLEISKRHIVHRDNTISAKAAESKRKVQEYPKNNLKAKYKKHLLVLQSEGYPLPSQRTAAYGWKVLSQTVKRLKTEMIPELLFTALLFPISDTERTTFHTLRDKRNKIAHGRLTRYPMRKAIENGKFLRDLAVKIDRHIVENFLLIEYSPDDL